MDAFSSMIISAETISVNMPKIRPFGMSCLRIDRFLGGERQLLDGEEQPDREGQGREHSLPAEGQERAAALRQLDGLAVGPAAMFSAQREKSALRNRADPEHHQHRQRQHGDDHGDLERQLHARVIEQRRTRR